MRHRSMLARSIRSLPASLLITAATLAQPGSPPVDPGLAAALSAATGIPPNQLQIVRQRAVALPQTKQRFTQYKVIDTRGRAFRSVALDPRLNVVPAPQLFAAERQAVRDANEGMTAGLRTAVLDIENEGNPNVDRLRVTVKMRMPGARPARPARRQPGAVGGLGRVALRQEARQNRNAIRDAVAPGFDAITAPDKPRDVVRSGPFVTAELRVATIRALALDPWVLFIGLDYVIDVPAGAADLHLDEAIKRTETNLVHDSGNVGEGIRVGLVEGREIDSNWIGLFRIDPTELQPGNLPNPLPDSPNHLRDVAAIIGNFHPGSWIGYAPDAHLVLGNKADYKAMTEWVLDHEASVINMSWYYENENKDVDGGLSSRDLYFDYIAANTPCTVLTAAGNEGTTELAYGRGYNVISVGDVLFDDTFTPCDDVISPDTNASSPSGSGRMLPVITAPGSNHVLYPGLTPKLGQSSAATAVASSIVALVQRRNDVLEQSPTAVRAILLASAIDPIRDSGEVPTGDDFRSQGLINAHEAVETADPSLYAESGYIDQRGHAYGAISSDDDCWRARLLQHDPVNGSRVRIALAWNSRTDDETTSVLDADLDLLVYDESGALVGESTSFDNSYEVVELMGLDKGLYVITVSDDPSADGVDDYETDYGLAWITGDNCVIEEILITDPVLELIARFLRWPPEITRIIGRGPIPVAFVEGRFERFVAVNEATGERGSVVVEKGPDPDAAPDADVDQWKRVDRFDLVRQRDRALAARRAGHVDPELRRLLLVNADGPRVLVRLELSPDRAPGVLAADAWQDASVRRKLADGLGQAFKERRIDATIRLSPDEPVVDVPLTPREIIALTDVGLIDRMSLAELDTRE